MTQPEQLTDQILNPPSQSILEDPKSETSLNQQINNDNKSKPDIKIYKSLDDVDDIIDSKNRKISRWAVIDNTPITNDWTILDIIDNRPPLNWMEFFNSIRDVELNDKDETISACVCFPLKKNIFRAFNYRIPEDIKLIIIGSEPDHQYTGYGEPRANGLCLSVDKRDIIPGSLSNVFKEIGDTFPTFKPPKHGDLTYWALQGVLLLNSSLTVEYDKPGSHSRMWEGFNIELIRYMDKINTKGIVYLLLGNDAIRLKNSISDKNKVIESAHPYGRDSKSFFGNNTFLKINQALYDLGYTAVDWNVY